MLVVFKIECSYLSSMFLVTFIPKFNLNFMLLKRGEEKEKKNKSDRMYESIKLVKKREKRNSNGLNYLKVGEKRVACHCRMRWDGGPILHMINAEVPLTRKSHG